MILLFTRRKRILLSVTQETHLTFPIYWEVRINKQIRTKPTRTLHTLVIADGAKPGFNPAQHLKLQVLPG